MNHQNNPAENLNQPMFRQSSQFYQQQNIPNPSNANNQPNMYGNYNSVFNPVKQIRFNGVQPKGMFDNHGFVNRGGMLHNNLHDILLYEEIKEYSVLIDSKDRNYQVYPNPFNYTVKFSPIPASKEKIGNRYVTHEDPNPTINEAFTNVRYVVLEDIILPFFTKIKGVKKEKILDDGRVGTVKEWKVDTSRPLTEYLYIVLSINEYNDVNIRSTNDVLSDSFATIYYDYATNETHYMGTTHNGIKIFQQDQLGTITNWKINFMDPYGMPLMCKHLDKHIKSELECTCEDEDNINPNCYRHNLNHPMNPIFQHHMHFRVGVVEPRLGKMTFN